MSTNKKFDKMKKLILLIFILALATKLNAQIYPFSENFNSMPSFSAPVGWATSIAGFQVYDTHGTNSSKGMCKQLTTFSQKDSVTSPIIGPLNTNDQLTFDYRIVQTSLYPSSPITMSANDKIEIKIISGVNSILIGQIDASNHITSTAFATKSYNLSAFSGQNIQVRIIATKASSTFDLFTDLDNIQVNATTSLSTINSNEEVTINYNPLESTPTIRINNLLPEDYRVLVMNTNGSTIFEQSLSATEEKVINIPYSLAKGCYILSVTGKKNAYNFKFLVQ
jgi:hypothetical protein